ncbi:MAG TPA: hypothetical protein VH834_02135 [Solirubrobacteraceae bacterium]
MVGATIRWAARGAAGAGLTAGVLVVRPAVATVEIARRAQRDLQARVADRMGQATLTLIDGALESPYADQAVQRVLESDLAERSIARALSGDLVDVVVRDLVRYEVSQRVVEQLLADGVAEQIATRFLNGPELERVVALALESDALQDAITEAFDSPGAERLLDRALESPGVERMIGRIVESRVLDEVAERLPRTEALWILVDQIVASPAVTEAITQQGMGFADQMAGAVRGRARTADARLERIAGRLLRRRSAEPESTDGATTAEPT